MEICVNHGFYDFSFTSLGFRCLSNNGGLFSSDEFLNRGKIEG